jgi:superoxide dismutase, Cu-Zn family
MSKSSAIFIAAAIAIVLPWRSTTLHGEGALVRGVAYIAGHPGSGISGVVHLVEQPTHGEFPSPSVLIVGIVTGLTPGLHGFHIHENGSCADTTVAFGGAGGHFDPGPFGNSGPDINHPFHMGDVPNLTVNRFGVGQILHISSRVTLSPGPLSLFDGNGSAIIVHANPDQGITGAAGSGVSGGPRAACGVIIPE